MDYPPRVWIILEEGNRIRMNGGVFHLFPLEIGGGKVFRPATVESRAHSMAVAQDEAPADADRGDAAEVISLLDRAILSLPTGKSYADAQLDDTQNLPRRAFRWRPPLRFSVRARTSISAPLGTFGFGFWNDPFSLSLGMGGAARKLPAPPQCAWFFYGSPPHDLPLVEGVPGSGWKAQTLAFRGIPSLLLAPIAVGGALLASFPPARRWAFSQARRFYHADECLLPVNPSAWHEYAIAWSGSAVKFFLDGEEMLHSDRPPRPPLGLVLWIDNQYALASPEKGFGFGVLPLAQTQALELEAARIETRISA